MMINRPVVLIAALAVAVAAAADRFYIEDFAVSPGNTFVVELQLDNEMSYTAFQADLYLPEGLTVNSDTERYGFALTDRKADHVLSVSLLPDGGYRLLSYSVTLGAYHDHKGPLLTVPVTVDMDFTVPTVIWLRRNLFTTTAGREIHFDDQSCSVSLEPVVLIGDVNEDGKVDITDLTTLIDFILGHEVSPFNSVNADTSFDGRLGIDDITGLVDIILRR